MYPCELRRLSVPARTDASSSMTEITESVGKTSLPGTGARRCLSPNLKWAADQISKIILRFVSPIAWYTEPTRIGGILRCFCLPPSPNGNGSRVRDVKPKLLLGLVATNSEEFRLSQQIGQRLCAHFFHDMSPMDLHGNLGKSKFGCYLLVHVAE